MARIRPKQIEEDKLFGDKYEHPAYGNVQVSRCSGGNMKLVGSDLVHNHYVVMKVGRCTKSRNHHSDKFFSDRLPMVEVAMTEQQWATFIASMNLGSGVPCTIQRAPVKGAKIERVPDLVYESNHDLAKDELVKYSEEITEGLQESLNELNEIIDSKGSIKKGDIRNLAGGLRSAIQAIVSNMPFHMEQHKEMMEDNVAAAKSDIDGYVAHTIQRVGIDAVKQNAPLLEDQSDE